MTLHDILLQRPLFNAIWHLFAIFRDTPKNRIMLILFFFYASQVIAQADADSFKKAFFDSEMLERVAFLEHSCQNPENLIDQSEADLLNDSSECSRWRSFWNLYKPDTVYLAYAGPYQGSPSSSFGHSFLLLAPHRKFRSFLSYPVINYSANVTHHSLPILLKGLFGQLQGRFSIVPLYEKLREYSDIENREIFLFPIQLTLVEKKRLITYLYAVQGYSFPYRFHDLNCAFHIEALLNIATDSSFQTSRGLALPTSILLKNRTRFGDAIVIPSIEERIRALSFSKYDLDIRTLAAWAEKHPQKAADILELIEWKMSRLGDLLPANETLAVERLRVFVLNQASVKRSLTKQQKQWEIRPPSKIVPSVQYPVKGDDPVSFLLLFRGLLHEYMDPISLYPENSEVKLFEMEIKYDQTLQINQWWLFYQASVPNHRSFEYFAWRMGMGGIKPYLDREILLNGALIGYGYSHAFVQPQMSIGALMNVFAGMTSGEHQFETLLFPDFFVRVRVGRFKYQIRFGYFSDDFFETAHLRKEAVWGIAFNIRNALKLHWQSQDDVVMFKCSYEFFLDPS